MLYRLSKCVVQSTRAWQAAAARLVAMAFQDGQALCVSHHSDFHRQSGHCVAVEMRNGVSRVQG